jgi:chromosome segregation ATPase
MSTPESRIEELRAAWQELELLITDLNAQIGPLAEQRDAIGAELVRGRRMSTPESRIEELRAAWQELELLITDLNAQIGPLAEQQDAIGAELVRLIIDAEWICERWTTSMPRVVRQWLTAEVLGFRPFGFFVDMDLTR